VKDPNFIRFVNGLEGFFASEPHRSFFEKIAAHEQAVISKQLNFVLENMGDLPSEILVRKFHLKNWENPNSPRDVLKMAILSWWMSPQTAHEVQDVLRILIRQKHMLYLDCYLQSKEITLALLYLETDVKHSDLFGNLLLLKMRKTFRGSDGEKEISRRFQVKIPDLELTWEIPPRPKKKGFRKGYHDHGSMATISQRNLRKGIREHRPLQERELLLEMRDLSDFAQSRRKINECILWFEQGIRP